MLNDVELIKMMRDSSLGNAVIQQFIKPRGSHPAMYRSDPLLITPGRTFLPCFPFTFAGDLMW